MDEKVTPLFPFGHGLSYTEFEYGNLKIDKHKVTAGETVEISLTLETPVNSQGMRLSNFMCVTNMPACPAR